MAEQIDVSLPNMVKACTSFSDAAASARKLLSASDQHVQSISGFWRGGAAKAFTNSLAQWHSEFELVIKELDTLHAKMQEVTKGYGATMQATEQAASQGLF